MYKNLIPKEAYESLYLLDAKYFKDKKIKAIFLDIDNTLVLPYETKPDEKADKFIKELLEENIMVCLVSNNKKSRVDNFNIWSLPSVYRAAKPLPFAYKKLISSLKLKKEDVAIIGDQIFSDILGANLLGIKSIYVNPIKEGKEGAFVYIKRKIEKFVIRKAKKGQFI